MKTRTTLPLHKWRGGRGMRPHAGLIIPAVLLLVACQTPPTAAPDATVEPTPVPEPVIARVGFSHAPQTIDPAMIGPLDAVANDLVENLFVGLTRLDGDSGVVEPALAESWEVSADGLTWTVHLRDDVFWVRINSETGQMEQVRPVTADDVVATMRRVCRPDVNAPLAKAVFVIHGCEQVHSQDLAALTQAIVEETIGARVLNDTTVEFTLSAPAAYFPTILAMPILRPIPADLLDTAGEEDWARPENVWTNGPFAVLPTVPPEDGYTLIVNPSWPLERPGNVEIVQITFSTTPEEAYAAWQAGTLDVVGLPDGEIASADFEGDPAYRLLAEPAVTLIAASYEIPPLDRPAVRRALSLALDRQTIIDETLEPAGLAGLPALTATPPGNASAPLYGQVGMPFDPDAARAALAEGGFENCWGIPPITLLTDDSELSGALGQQYIQMWADNLGCPASAFTLEQQPLQDVLVALTVIPDSRQERRAGLVTLGWQADYPDAHHWPTDIYACRADFPDAYLNQGRECIEADGWLSEAAVTDDPALRLALYTSIDEAFFGREGEMPVIPVYFHARALAVQPWLAIVPTQAGPLRFEAWLVD